MANTQTATKAKDTGNGAAGMPKPKKERRARGSGPMQLTFVDSKGKSDHKRVPADCTGVRVKVGTKDKVYTVEHYSEQTKNTLAFLALATRAKTQVANHSDDVGSNIFDLIDAVDADFKHGRLYSKSEGGPRGKPFDAELHAEAYKQALAWMAKRNVVNTVKDKNGHETKVPVKPLSDQAYGDLVTWLQTADTEKRKQRIAVWSKNEVYRKMYKTLQAQKMTISEPTAFEEAF